MPDKCFIVIGIAIGIAIEVSAQVFAKRLADHVARLSERRHPGHSKLEERCCFRSEFVDNPTRLSRARFR